MRYTLQQASEICSQRGKPVTPTTLRYAVQQGKMAGGKETVGVSAWVWAIDAEALAQHCGCDVSDLPPATPPAKRGARPKVRA